MYKITLYDMNRNPIADGTACFFTEDIDDFERRWTVLETDKDRIDRFLRSKEGEIISDFWLHGEEYNIVQEDNHAKIFYEKQFLLENVTFEAANFYDCKTKFHVNRWNCTFRWIRFKDEFIRIVSFTASGVCRWHNIFEDRLDAVSCYGNLVLENIVKYSPCYNGQNPIEKLPDPSFEDFSGNSIATICWLESLYFKTQKSMETDWRNFRITKKVMNQMFANVVGECG